LAEQMTSAEAAQQLGIGVRQVERMVASGQLVCVGSVGRALLVDAASVHRHRERGAAKGRPWSTDTLRAAVELLQDGRTDRLESTQRSRLRAKLRHMTASDLVRAAHRRAKVRRYRASTSFLEALRGRVLLTGGAAVDADRVTAGRFGLGTTQRDIVDGYVSRIIAEEVVDRYRLVDDAKGNVTLRIADDVIGARGVADLVTVALDLAESLDARERAAGLAFLDERLAALR
jgi:excisionase family DNA binding protein